MEIGAPMRVMIFGWLMLKNKILTLDNLTRRGWHMVNRCIMCKEQAESVRHMMQHCKFMKGVRRELQRRMLVLNQSTAFQQGRYSETLLKSNKETRRIQMVLVFVI